MSTEIGTATVNLQVVGASPRLRVLELPMQHVGEVSSTPFAFVLDRVEEPDEMIPDNFGELVRQLGATGVIIFAQEVELE